MGTFVTNPSEELFDDKEPAPGTSRPAEWTSANVLTSTEVNDLRDACYDLRTAVLEVEAAGVDLSDASPQAVGTAAAGVGTTASRNDHVHAHGTQLGGTLHAVAGASAGFMSASDKTKLDAITGTHTGSNTGDVTLGTANGLSLVAQALSLATAVAGVSAGALSAADKTKLDGVTTGATAGVTTMAAVGSSANANGASISGVTLTLQPASGSQPGVVTTGTQTFAGAKTFSSAPAFPDATTQASSAIITPSVVIAAQAAWPASLNLTSEGTIDWHHIGSINAVRPALTATIKKIGGEGDMFHSFEWIKAPSASSAITNGDLDFPCTISTTDDISAAGLSAYENGSYINVSATQIGHGFQFRCRAMRATRVLRVYMGRNATTVLCTATLTGGTSDTESIAVAGGSPTVFQLGQLVVITFNAATDNQFLHVKFQSTTTHSTAGTVNFNCATLASS